MSEYSQILENYRLEGRLRAIPAEAGTDVLDLSTNDYLGLSLRHDLTEEFMSQSLRIPFTSAASRLLASRQREYGELEDWLSAAYGKEALLFNSGYHANTGCVSALSGVKGTAIVADKLVHASIIDGIRLGKAPFRRFLHNDVGSLRRELEKASASAECVWVIVESVYSMDGDMAPLREIAALKASFPKMMLYVDEAHALGVFGAKGLGVCESLGLLPEIDVLIGTFGKACASMGAFAAASRELKDFLLNSARSFIFSTALPPVNVAFTHFMLRKIAGMEAERKHLAEISELFRRRLSALTGLPSVSSSQIVPLMAGGNARALELSESLSKHDILALPIRKPTVPAGTERIRFSLNASLQETDIDHVINVLSDAL